MPILEPTGSSSCMCGLTKKLDVNRSRGTVTEYYVDGRGRKQGSHRVWWRKSGKLRTQYQMRNGRVDRVDHIADQMGRPVVLPEGEIDVWKACKTTVGTETKNVFVRLRVPVDARRVTPPMRINKVPYFEGNRVSKWLLAKTYKSRVSHAKVIAIEDDEGNNYLEACSFVYRRKVITYKVGSVVRSTKFDSDPEHGCGQGIHVHRYRDQCQIWFIGPDYPVPPKIDSTTD